MEITNGAFDPKAYLLVMLGVLEPEKSKKKRKLKLIASFIYVFKFVKINYIGSEPQKYSPQIHKFLFIICEFAVKIRSRASRN